LAASEEFERRITVISSIEGDQFVIEINPTKKTIQQPMLMSHWVEFHFGSLHYCSLAQSATSGTQFKQQKDGFLNKKRKRHQSRRTPKKAAAGYYRFHKFHRQQQPVIVLEPRTAGEEKEFGSATEFIIHDLSFQAMTPTEEKVIVFLKSVICSRELETLLKSTEALFSTLKGSTRKNQLFGKTIYFGQWRKYKLQVHQTSDSTKMKTWMETNDFLLGYVHEIFQLEYPHVEKLFQPYGQIGGFATVAICNNAKTTLHRDKNDSKHGVSAVIPFGQFCGGDLVFPNLGIHIHAVSGDLVFFKSSDLLHGNNEVKEGSRFSLVFFFFGHNMHFGAMAKK